MARRDKARGKGHKPGVQPRVKGLPWRPAAVLAAGLLAYANGLFGVFLFDDFGSIVRNPTIRSASLALAPPADTAVAGRPLVNLSFATNYAFGGLDVFGFHVVNLALHLACGLLLFGLVRRTIARIAPARASLADDVAFAAAVVWVVHPLTSEVVQYLTQRTESLMAVCYLTTMYASVRALESRRAGLWELGAIAACLAGMASKETMVTAPLMVVLYDRVFVFDSIGQALRTRWRLYACLAATWLPLAWLVWGNGQTLSAGFASAHASTWTYLLNQPVMLTRYLRLALWPSSLVLYYGWPPALTIGVVWPYALLVLALVAATIVAFVRWPRLGFLAVFALAVLAPTSSVLPIATEVGAERRMYLPLAALATLAALGGAWLCRRLLESADERRVGRALAASALVAAVPLALLTAARNREYSSPLTMARTVLARWPSPNAHELVGTELAAAGQHLEAIEQLREAAPDYPPARYFLGSELVAAGQADAAIVELQTLIRDEPNLPVVPSARLLLARAFAAKSQWPQAADELRLVLAARPSSAEAHGLLADVLAAEQSFDEALPHYRMIVAANPGDGNAWTGLGVALVALGKPADALAAFRGAVTADPRNGHFRQNLARALLAQATVAEAVDQARQAIALDPNDPGAHEVLGRALAAQGRIDEARQELLRALQIDASYAPAADALRALPVR